MQIPPKNIIVDLLRVYLTDPRSRGEALNTETLDGGSSEYTLTPTSGKVQCITSLKIDGTAQKKWKDYIWDAQNQKVIFNGNTSSGTGNIEIIYKQGTGWIFPDKPIKELSTTSFPRLNVIQNPGTGLRMGPNSAPVESAVPFQIDVWTKPKYIATIDSVKYEGDRLAEYFAIKSSKVFEEHEEDLYPVMHDVVLSTTIQDMPFDSETQSYHKLFIVQLNGINMGSISI